MENITRTVYGAELQTNLLLNITPPMRPNSTLNQKLGIEANTSLSSNDRAAMRYICIGNGGHDFVRGADGRVATKTIQHRATDGAPYSMLPFVLREPNNDLTPADMAKYALRRPETHDGRNYIAYYLRRIDITTTSTVLELKTVLNNQTTVTPFVPTAINLNPTPPDLTVTGVNVTTGDYVSATAKLPFNMTVEDVRNFLDAVNIIYGSNDYGVISEIGLCSGVDKVVSAPSVSGGNFNYAEAIGVQIVAHLNALYVMQFNNDGIQTLIDVGATEPMLTLQNNP